MSKSTNCILWMRTNSKAPRKLVLQKGRQIIDTYSGPSSEELLSMARSNSVTTVVTYYEYLEGGDFFKEVHKLARLVGQSPDLTIVLRIHQGFEITIDASNNTVFELVWYHHLKALANGLNENLSVMDMLRAM